ncbi:MAG: tetratricopeptide repeat protein [Limisphaerales bacterium]
MKDAEVQSPRGCPRAGPRASGQSPSRSGNGRSRRFGFWTAHTAVCLPVLLLLLVSAPPAQAQPAPERLAFDAAVRALQGGLAEQAARDFAGFLEQFPQSVLAADAALLEARARSESGDFAGAVRRLEELLPAAGPLKDQYLYELGRARAGAGDAAGAVAAYEQLLREATGSPLGLASAVAAGQARLRAGEAAAAAALFEAAEGPFAAALRDRPDDPLTLRGGLLLGEAQLRVGRVDAARATLEAARRPALPPPLVWEREQLLVALELTNARPATALALATNLLPLAGGDPALAARSRLIEATLLARMGRAVEAVAVLTNNLAAATPPDELAESLLLVPAFAPPEADRAPLLAAVRAVRSRFTDPPVADAAAVALAELALRPGPGAATNAPAVAAALLTPVAANQPPSPLAGRAWLGLGFAAVMSDDLPGAAAAFAAAAASLPVSPAQAVALFKLGDIQLALTNAPAAVTTLQRLVEAYGNEPEIRAGLLPRALYQIAAAAVAGGQGEVAAEAVNRALEWFPGGEFREATLSLFGQSLAPAGQPDAVREVLERLVVGATNSVAAGEVRLALARSYLREGRWADARRNLEPLAEAPPPVGPRAAFDLAWVTFQQGDATGAHGRFTNFLARFPGDPRAPQAQQWVADHLFSIGDHVGAETAYQLLFQQTNWPPTALTHEARLMAGRAALARQSYRDAKPYFRWLIAQGPPAGTNALITSNLAAQAYFALGDSFLFEPEGDDRFTDAMTAFATVIEKFPGTREALLARGKLANAHFQRAELDPARAAASYTNAAALYLEVMGSDGGIAARSQAEVGLGLVRERQAAGAAEEDQAGLRQVALEHFLRVLFGGNLRPGEPADAFWVNRAGLEAARLAESLGRREEAARILEALQKTFPAAAQALAVRVRELRAGP